MRKNKGKQPEQKANGISEELALRLNNIQQFCQEQLKDFDINLVELENDPALLFPWGIEAFLNAPSHKDISSQKRHKSTLMLDFIRRLLGKIATDIKTEIKKNKAEKPEDKLNIIVDTIFQWYSQSEIWLPILQGKHLDFTKANLLNDINIDEDDFVRQLVQKNNIKIKENKGIDDLITRLQKLESSDFSFAHFQCLVVYYLANQLLNHINEYTNLSITRFSSSKTNVEQFFSYLELVTVSANNWLPAIDDKDDNSAELSIQLIKTIKEQFSDITETHSHFTSINDQLQWIKRIPGVSKFLDKFLTKSDTIKSNILSQVDHDTKFHNFIKKTTEQNSQDETLHTEIQKLEKDIQKLEKDILKLDVTQSDFEETYNNKLMSFIKMHSETLTSLPLIGIAYNRAKPSVYELSIHVTEEDGKKNTLKEKIYTTTLLRDKDKIISLLEIEKKINQKRQLHGLKQLDNISSYLNRQYNSEESNQLIEQLKKSKDGILSWIKEYTEKEGANKDKKSTLEELSNELEKIAGSTQADLISTFISIQHTINKHNHICNREGLSGGSVGLALYSFRSDLIDLYNQFNVSNDPNLPTTLEKYSCPSEEKLEQLKQKIETLKPRFNDMTTNISNGLDTNIIDEIISIINDYPHLTIDVATKLDIEESSLPENSLNSYSLSLFLKGALATKQLGLNLQALDKLKSYNPKQLDSLRLATRSLLETYFKYDGNITTPFLIATLKKHNIIDNIEDSEELKFKKIKQIIEKRFNDRQNKLLLKEALTIAHKAIEEKHQQDLEVYQTYSSYFANPLTATDLEKMDPFLQGWQTNINETSLANTLSEHFPELQDREKEQLATEIYNDSSLQSTLSAIRKEAEEKVLELQQSKQRLITQVETRYQKLFDQIREQQASYIKQYEQYCTILKNTDSDFNQDEYDQFIQEWQQWVYDIREETYFAEPLSKFCSDQLFVTTIITSMHEQLQTKEILDQLSNDISEEIEQLRQLKQTFLIQKQQALIGDPQKLESDQQSLTSQVTKKQEELDSVDDAIKQKEKIILMNNEICASANTMKHSRIDQLDQQIQVTEENLENFDKNSSSFDKKLTKIAELKQKIEQAFKTKDFTQLHAEIDSYQAILSDYAWEELPLDDIKANIDDAYRAHHGNYTDAWGWYVWSIGNYDLLLNDCTKRLEEMKHACITERKIAHENKKTQLTQLQTELTQQKAEAEQLPVEHQKQQQQLQAQLTTLKMEKPVIEREIADLQTRISINGCFLEASKLIKQQNELLTQLEDLQSFPITPQNWNEFTKKCADINTDQKKLTNDKAQLKQQNASLELDSLGKLYETLDESKAINLDKLQSQLATFLNSRVESINHTYHQFIDNSLDGENGIFSDHCRVEILKLHDELVRYKKDIQQLAISKTVKHGLFDHIDTSLTQLASFLSLQQEILRNQNSLQSAINDLNSSDIVEGNWPRFNDQYTAINNQYKKFVEQTRALIKRNNALDKTSSAELEHALKKNKNLKLEHLQTKITVFFNARLASIEIKYKNYLNSESEIFSTEPYVEITQLRDQLRNYRKEAQQLGLKKDNKQELINNIDLKLDQLNRFLSLHAKVKSIDLKYEALKKKIGENSFDYFLIGDINFYQNTINETEVFLKNIEQIETKLESVTSDDSNKEKLTEALTKIKVTLLAVKEHCEKKQQELDSTAKLQERVIDLCNTEDQVKLSTLQYDYYPEVDQTKPALLFKKSSDDTTIIHTRLLSSTYTNVDFNGYQLIGANFSGKTLANCTFHQAGLTRCNLSGIQLAGNDFSDAKFIDCQFGRTLKFMNNEGKEVIEENKNNSATDFRGIIIDSIGEIEPDAAIMILLDNFSDPFFQPANTQNSDGKRDYLENLLKVIVGYREKDNNDQFKAQVNDKLDVILLETLKRIGKQKDQHGPLSIVDKKIQARKVVDIFVKHMDLNQVLNVLETLADKSAQQANSDYAYIFKERDFLRSNYGNTDTWVAIYKAACARLNELEINKKDYEDTYKPTLQKLTTHRITRSNFKLFKPKSKGDDLPDFPADKADDEKVLLNTLKNAGG